MTMWGNHGVIITSTLSYYISAKRSENLILKRVNQLFLEWTLNTQIMVTLAYWILLHSHMMFEMQRRGMDEPIMIAR